MLIESNESDCGKKVFCFGIYSGLCSVRMEFSCLFSSLKKPKVGLYSVFTRAKKGTREFKEIFCTLCCFCVQQGQWVLSYMFLEINSYGSAVFCFRHDIFWDSLCACVPLRKGARQRDLLGGRFREIKAAENNKHKEKARWQKLHKHMKFI